MSGMHTGGKILLIANNLGFDVESYKHELECVLAIINNGRLGYGVDPKSYGWASDAHAKAVQLVIQHAQQVASAIAAQRLKDAAQEGGK